MSRFFKTASLLGFTLSFLCFGILPSHAGVIVLKTGKEVSGLITKKTDEYVAIRVNGELSVYQRSAIASIRGRKPQDLSGPDIIAATADSDFLKALQLASQGSFLHAEAMFFKLLERDPTDLNSQEALHIISDYRVDIVSHDYALNLFKGAYYFFSNEYEKAIAAYLDLLSHYPHAVEVYYNLAKAYQATGKDQEAAGYLERLLAVRPQDLDALFSLGEAYYSLGNHQKAVSSFEQLISIFPDDSQAHAFLGTSYYALGNAQLGKEHLQKAKILFEEHGDHQQAREIETLLENLL